MKKINETEIFFLDFRLYYVCIINFVYVVMEIVHPLFSLTFHWIQLCKLE